MTFDGARPETIALKEQLVVLLDAALMGAEERLMAPSSSVMGQTRGFFAFFDVGGDHHPVMRSYRANTKQRRGQGSPGKTKKRPTATITYFGTYSNETDSAFYVEGQAPSQTGTGTDQKRFGPIKL